MFLFLLLYTLTFLAIGLWIGLKALERRLLPKEFLFIGALAASLTLYYAVFYLYLLSPSFGSIITKLVMGLSLLVLVRLIVNFRRSTALRALARKFYLVPLLITAAVMVAYSTVFFSCVSRPPALAGYGELDNRTFCHTSGLPFDNSLGFIFGNNILRNQDKKQAIDWNMVDRPPLEIAATLPILDQGSHDSQFTKYYAYYAFSIFLQLSWVSVFWGAFQLLRMNRTFQLLAFLALGTTGFFYLNSVFVWPKLLAASLVFAGIFVLLGTNKASKYRYLPFAALVVSLGILSHTAVLFTVLPFAAYYLFVLIRKKKIDWRYMGAALAVGFVILAPWSLYKASVVKTDRLAKWYFAGITSGTDTRGTVQTVTDQYKTLSVSEVVRIRGQNVKTMVTGNYASITGCQLNSHGFRDKCLFKEWRALTFFSVFFAFEVLSLGWLAVIYQFIRRKIDILDKELVLLTSAALLFWLLSMFQPQTAVVHQGSYATLLLAFLLIIKKLSELPRLYIGFIAGCQIVVFYLAWVTPYFVLSAQ